MFQQTAPQTSKRTRYCLRWAVVIGLQLCVDVEEHSAVLCFAAEAQGG